MTAANPRTPPSSISVLHKRTDNAGRTRLYFAKPVSLDEYIDGCYFLQRDLVKDRASRWSIRGLLEGEWDRATLLSRLPASTVPYELNWIPAAGTPAQPYLWISHNEPSRAPSLTDRQRFVTQVHKHHIFERSFSKSFQERTNRLLAKATEYGLSVLCHDPAGEWGTIGDIPEKVVSTALAEEFFLPREYSAEVLAGSGYSLDWHYLFALQDAAAQVMAIFVLAHWPWGFEATYTIINSRYRGRSVPAARLLMLVASGLVLHRHGPAISLYGEANLANCHACIGAGYELCLPVVSSSAGDFDENVVWADNPMRSAARPVRATDGRRRIPSHTESRYEDFVLMRMNAQKLEPYVENFVDLLARSAI